MLKVRIKLKEKRFIDKVAEKAVDFLRFTLEKKAERMRREEVTLRKALDLL